MLLYKKLFFGIIFNTCLFIFLIIGIQNSSKKSKINFFKIESIRSIQKMYMRNKIFKVFRGQSYPQTTDLSSDF